MSAPLPPTTGPGRLALRLFVAEAVLQLDVGALRGRQHPRGRAASREMLGDAGELGVDHVVGVVWVMVDQVQGLGLGPHGEGGDLAYRGMSVPDLARVSLVGIRAVGDEGIRVTREGNQALHVLL